MPGRRRFEIVVLGGGPAGTVAARSLAALGYRVALVSSPRRHGALEGISPRSAEALRSAGCAEAVGRLGAAVPRRSDWSAVHVAAGEEHLVERRTFDEALRRDARLAGVALIEGRVDAVAESRDGCEVTGRTARGGPLRLRAEFVVEARGRSVTPARAGRRRSPAATALGREWRLPATSPSESVLFSFEDGWAWLAMPVGGRGHLQIDVSSDALELRSKRDLEEFYDSLVERIPAARRRLATARPAAAVTARDATAVLAADLVGSRSIRIGDAAFAIDPLSGQGIFEAVATALAAPAVVNTLLRRPADRALAKEFYARRVEDTFFRLARTGRDFYRAESRWGDRPFWHQRQRWPDDEPARPTGRSASIQARPVSVDAFIVTRRVIVTPDHPRGVWQLDGVELVPLLEHAAARRSARGAELAAEHAERSGSPIAAIGRALSWLRQRGLV
jgi:flavin-dependent dehydrogenase